MHVFNQKCKNIYTSYNDPAGYREFNEERRRTCI